MTSTLRPRQTAAFALGMSIAMAATAQSLVKLPMICSHGDDHQTFAVVVTMARSRPAGALLQIRIDGLPSGVISHFGLNHLHDMNTDYSLPRGATYIEGSARVISGTGTQNAAQGAFVRQLANTISLLLPAHIESGSSYTPPSFEFTMRIDAHPGARLDVGFLHYQVTANAFVVGDVLTSCAPATPAPIIASTLVTRADGHP